MKFLGRSGCSLFCGRRFEQILSPFVLISLDPGLMGFLKIAGIWDKSDFILYFLLLIQGCAEL